MTPIRWITTVGCVAVALAVADPVPAQTLWRCGADGRTFSDRPCADGVPIAAAPRPTPEAVDEAHEVAARERAALRRLVHERWRRHAEAARAGLGPAGIHDTPLSAHADPAEARGDRDKRSDRRHPARRYVVRPAG